MKQAPMFIVVCVNEEGAWKRSYDGNNHADVDGSIIVEHICLSAADCGLGTCWVCAFDLDEASKILDLPEDLRPMTIILIDYPASDSIPEKKRKPMDEIVKSL